MKKINTTLTVISIVLLCTLVSFVGCSDMMAKLGNISLTIDLDTPEVEVASYTMEGNLVDSNSRFTLNNIVPPRHTLSELKEGRWNLTVKAFDDQGSQIGIGTKVVDLKAGQVVDTSLLVVFSQSAPLASAFTIAGPSRQDAREGSITGTTAKMEYRLASAAADALFTPCTVGSTLLALGTYHIRLAQAHGLEASESLTVTIPAYQPTQLTIASPTLTTTKEYDGTNAIQGSITAGALTGVLGSDEVVVHAQASYDSALVGNSRNITVTYSLSGADALNYTKPADTTVAGIISKKQLSIAGTTVTTTKEYDGSTSATVTNHGVLGGKVGTEEITVTATASYQDKTAGSGKLISVSYTLGGADAENYHAPANTNFSGEITRKTLAVASSPSIQLSKEYDGTPTAVVTAPGSLVGVLSGDLVMLQSSASYTDKDVGSSKSITVSNTLTGSDANNYTAPGDTVVADGVITQKRLTVTDFNLVSTKEYDGSSSSTINNVACSGMVPTEDVQVNAIATYNSPTAGTNKPITVTYALSGADSANYHKPADSIATATGEITRKQLRVSGTVPTLNKVYDGTTSAQIEPNRKGTLDGVVDGDTVTFTAVGNYDTKSASQTKTVTVVYTLTGDDSANYIKPEDGTYQGVIQKYYLSVNGGTGVATTKTYDGTLDAEITQEPSLVGVVAGDSVTLHTTAAYETDGAATGKKVWVYYNIDGDDTANYVPPQTTLATDQGVINKMQLSVSGTTVASKSYDGTTSATLSNNGTLEDVVDGDTVTFTAAASYATKVAGSSKDATVVYTIDGVDKNNYLAPANGSLTGTIHKRLLTAKDIDVTGSKEYDGTRNTSITACTINNLVAGDMVTVQKTATFDTKQAGSGKSITVSFSLDGTDKDNYIEPDSRVVYSNGIITQKPLTVAGTSYSTTKEYDGTATIPITSNGTLQGVAEGDVVTLSNVTGFYTSADIGTNKAFTIRYTISGTDAANYTVPDTTGTSGTITKIAMNGNVFITGSPVFGQVLTAVPDLDNTETPTYQWKRNGTAISGATNTTYSLVEADIGKKITVTATATGTNYTGSITSEETVTVTKTAGSALSGTFEAYYPISSATQTNITQVIINLTGFTANQTGIEASISTDGTTYGSYSALMIDSRGRAMISVTSAQKIKLRYEETSTRSAGADLLLTLGEKDLAVGDYYAGGVVGYIYESTDTGYIANQVHGLIAAKSDTSDGIKWSSNITLQIGTAVGIGTGLANTQAIIDALDGSEVGRYAAKEANSMRDGGYDDWFLPSLNELKKLRDNRVLIGNFSTTWLSRYMSSSESIHTKYPAELHYHVVFFDRNDDIIEVWTKDAGTHIRAVRYF